MKSPNHLDNACPSVIIALLCAMCLQIAIPVAAQQGLPGSGSYELVRNRVVLPVYLNQVGPYPFLLDNTAIRHVIDTDVADYLELSMEPVASDGHEDESSGPMGTEAVTIHLGGAALGTSPAVVMGLTPFAEQLGRPVAGVLAGRALEGALTLDPPSMTFYWVDANTPPADPVTILLETGDAPRVEAGVGSARLMFQVDSMFEGAARVHADVALDLGHEDEEENGLRMRTADPAQPGERFVRLTSIRLGPSELLAPIALVREQAGEPVLGMGFLRRFRVTFGFPMTYLRVEPVEGTLPRESSIVGLGMIPDRVEEGYWRVQVVAGGPADEAGVEPGDALVAVDGVPMAGQPFVFVQEALRGIPGEPTAVVVLRDDEQLSFTMQARRLL